MNIGELAKEADVTPRTIRYYVEQGLLPPPERGYPAEYTAEHVERLELIKLLKDERMPLEEIKTTVQQLTLDEVRELIGKQRELQANKPAEPPDSAAEYLTRVLGNAQQRNEMIENTMTKKLQNYAPPPPPPASPAMPMPLPASPPQVAPGGAAPGNADAAPPQPPAQDAGAWQRIQLTPSVEIHYQLNAPDEHRSLVDRLVELAARLMGRGPEKGNDE